VHEPNPELAQSMLNVIVEACALDVGPSRHQDERSATASDERSDRITINLATRTEIV
jgi:hypothetical protein